MKNLSLNKTSLIGRAAAAAAAASLETRRRREWSQDSGHWRADKSDVAYVAVADHSQAGPVGWWNADDDWPICLTTERSNVLRGGSSSSTEQCSLNCLTL